MNGRGEVCRVLSLSMDRCLGYLTNYEKWGIKKEINSLGLLDPIIVIHYYTVYSVYSDVTVSQKRQLNTEISIDYEEIHRKR